MAPNFKSDDSFLRKLAVGADGAEVNLADVLGDHAKDTRLPTAQRKVSEKTNENSQLLLFG